MERIDSTQNPRVKAARALHSVKGRDRSGLFLCEGEHMVREAVRAAGMESPLHAPFALGSAFAVDTLFVADEQAERYADLLDETLAARAYLVPAHVMEAISTVKTPQGIAAVVRLQSPRVTAGAGVRRHRAGSRRVWHCGEFGSAGRGNAARRADGRRGGRHGGRRDLSPSVLGEKLVLLEAVQDPGNVGAILRTMDAAGFHGAVLAPGCADPFSPKALRATMGSDLPRAHAANGKRRRRLPQRFGTRGTRWSPRNSTGQTFLPAAACPEKLCLIIGNEGAGITRETLAMATHRYRLPMKGGAESLNAAVAAAIMIYDIAYRP